MYNMLTLMTPVASLLSTVTERHPKYAIADRKKTSRVLENHTNWGGLSPNCKNACLHMKSNCQTHVMFTTDRTDTKLTKTKKFGLNNALWRLKNCNLMAWRQVPEKWRHQEEVVMFMLLLAKRMLGHLNLMKWNFKNHIHYCLHKWQFRWSKKQPKQFTVT